LEIALQYNYQKITVQREKGQEQLLLLLLLTQGEMFKFGGLFGILEVFSSSKINI